ncbi:hypothetical protein ACFQKF_20430 [Halalkalicoccus sp. GCM10025322]|uniref:hypothetical protein n=1 Tax=Halalkalicoccus TaxID=332246 RepID=UPI002F96CC78
MEITIVEPLSGIDAIVETVARRLLYREMSHVTELKADRLEIAGLDDTPVTFSLDGEIQSEETVRISVRPRALSVRGGTNTFPGSTEGSGERRERAAG